MLLIYKCFLTIQRSKVLVECLLQEVQLFLGVSIELPFFIKGVLQPLDVLRLKA